MAIRKMYEKAISFLLAVIMILSTAAGYLPFSAKTVHAGGMSLKTIENGTDVTNIDPAFDPAQDTLITFKWNSKNGYKISNVDNDLSPVFDASSDTTAKYAKVDNLGDKKPKMIYYKAAYDKINDVYYNVEVMVNGWKKQPFAWIDNLTGKTIPPFLKINTTKIGISVRGLQYIDVTFKWTKYGEDSSGNKKSIELTDSEKNNLRSYVTLSDLDAAQAFRINEQEGLVGIYKLKGYDHVYQEGDNVVSKDVLMTDADKQAWVTAYLKGTDQFSVRFYEGMNYSGLGTGDVKGNGRNSKGYPITSYYSFTSKSLLTIPKVVNPNEADIEKRVGNKGTDWDNAEEASDKETAYEIHGYEEFDYLVKSAGPGVETEDYVITDSLEKCLEIEDASKITITDKDGRNVTGQFEIRVSGRTITCKAKTDYLASDSFKNEEQVFLLRYTVHRRKDADVRTFMAPWMDEDGFTFFVPNKANVAWTIKDKETKQKDSGECWITDQIKANLKVEKDVKYDRWHVGDEVEYAVEVTQTRQDGYAVNVEVTDRDIPPYLQLLNGSWKVSGPNQGTAASMSSLGENGWVVTCPLLQYGDSIVIRFKCKALEDSNGKDTINTARATADNFMDEEGELKYTGDSAEIWVNSPDLTVDKTANAYEYQIGDKVQYTVTVRNAKDYTVAENLEVSDISLPDGLQITEDSQDGTGVRVAFSPDYAATQIGWPVPDGTTSIAKQNKENSYTVKRNKNTWTVKAKYLPSDAVMTITFDCIALKAVNGIETQNQVSVTADNFLDAQGNKRTAQDDAEVYVNTAAFEIDKYVTDGNYEWQVGDHVPFDVVVRNINDDGTLDLADRAEYAGLSEEEKSRLGAAGKTVARNVVITDADIPEGFRLDTDSVSVESVEAYSEEAMYQESEPGISATEAAEQDALEVDESPEVYEGEQEGYAEVAGEQELSNGKNPETDVEETYNESNSTPDTDETQGSGEEAVKPAVSEEQPAYIPRPAETISVEGIPEKYDNHVAGTPDNENQLDEEAYNETVPTDITWELLTVGNGWQLKISDLPAGYDVRVHFTCEALKASNGQEGVNIGTVTADNAAEKADDSEAYVNTAVLSLNKELINRYISGGSEDKNDNREDYEFRVGEDITYKVTVRNIQPGSVARNLVVSDLSLPEGLALKDGEDAVTVEGIPAEYVNPIAGTPDTSNQTDPEHYKETERIPVAYQLVREGTGWKLLIDSLPCTENDSLNQWNYPVAITFHCTATEAVNGWEIINTAKAYADNAAEVKDSERVWINSPVLVPVKNADKDEYLVGDTVTYTVDLTQQQTGCVARDVVISDEIMTEGVKLQKNSVVLLDGEGRKFNIPDENIEIKGNSFIVHTGMNLIKEQGYYNWDAENGGYSERGSFNPIGVTEQSHLILEYAVEITDRNLAGQTIFNKVKVNSDENIPKEAEEEVPVEGAALDIVKESDKAQYLVGETGVYKLTIREIREGVTAKQVVIRDSFNTDGVEIQLDTLEVKLNGKEIKDVKIILDSNGFVIETGKDLKVVDKIEVLYHVLFKEASLDGAYVVNTATAKGSNTAEETQDNRVLVVDENPSLEVTKTSDKQYYKVGETGHYSVTVAQNTKAATARNVIIKDEVMTEGARILPESIVIRNTAGRVMDEAELEHNDTRYTIFTGKDLAYGEKFTVTYDVLFEKESLAGKDILNVARATCDNLKTEQKDPGPQKITDGLTVYKTAEPQTGSLVKNGDVITYHIAVQNTSEETKKVVLVKDRIPEYTEYVEGSAEGSDLVSADVKELQGKAYTVFVIQNLKAGAVETVSFQVKVKDAPQDGMILNVAQVRETKAAPEDITEDTWNHEGFRNTNETVHYLDTRWVKDSNTVYIDAGKLSIEKTSDKLNYAVGETGYYTLTVTQQREGAVSKNVAVEDSLKERGAVIQADTIQVKKNGKELSGAVMETSEMGFSIQTGTDLSYGDEITITYEVLFQEASLAGKTVHNVALVRDDETAQGEEPKDDNTVTVGKSGLLINKTSDKESYKVGEIAHYTLEVRTAADEFTAENVVIRDVMKQQGANVVSGTVKVYLDEKRLDTVDVEEIDNGFVIATHTDLSGVQVMRVTYDVTMEKESLAGRDIQNAATADADNTDPVDTVHSVKVPGKEKPDKPTETPVPTETPKPTETPDPTATPVPIETPKPTEAPSSTVTPAPQPTSTPVPTATPSGSKPGNTGTGSGTGSLNSSSGNSGSLKDTSSSLKGNVQTGDTSPIFLIMMVGILGICGLTVYVIRRKKGKK